MSNSNIHLLTRTHKMLINANKKMPIKKYQLLTCNNNDYSRHKYGNPKKNKIRYSKNTKKRFSAKYFQQIKNGHFKMSIFYFPIYFCVKKKVKKRVQSIMLTIPFLDF